MKHCFLFFILFSFSTIQAQHKGELTFDISVEDQEKYQNARIGLSLIKNDSVYARAYYCTVDNFDWKIDSVDEGIYRLKITFNDTVLFSYEQVRVVAEKSNFYDFYINGHTGKWRRETADSNSRHDQPVKAEISTSVLYGDNTYYQPVQRYQNKMVSGEMAYNIFPFISKYYTLGIKIGGQYARTEFHHDTTHVNGKQILSRHYSYADVNVGIVNRFTFFNNRLERKDGLKLDIGLLYHLPVFFRQVEKIDYDVRKNTRRIHTYTDFTAMVRLGYKFIGIQAEYSLSDFLKRAYIESPQLRAGIVFFIPAY